MSDMNEEPSDILTAPDTTDITTMAPKPALPQRKKRRKPTLKEDMAMRAAQIEKFVVKKRHSIAAFTAALPVALAVGSATTTLTGSAILGGGAAGAAFNLIASEVKHGLATRHNRSRERKLRKKLTGKKGRNATERKAAAKQRLKRDVPAVVGGAVGGMAGTWLGGHLSRFLSKYWQQGARIGAVRLHRSISRMGSLRAPRPSAMGWAHSMPAPRFPRLHDSLATLAGEVVETGSEHAITDGAARGMARAMSEPIPRITRLAQSLGTDAVSAAAPRHLISEAAAGRGIAFASTEPILAARPSLSSFASDSLHRLATSGRVGSIAGSVTGGTAVNDVAIPMALPRISQPSSSPASISSSLSSSSDAAAIAQALASEVPPTPFSRPILSTRPLAPPAISNPPSITTDNVNTLYEQLPPIARRIAQAVENVGNAVIKRETQRRIAMTVGGATQKAISHGLGGVGGGVVAQQKVRHRHPVSSSM